MRPLFVYLAGPLSTPPPGGTVEDNIHAGLSAAARLMDEGVDVFVPHLSHYWDARHPRDYHDWIAYDLRMIDRVDALVRLPGESAGADREVSHALSIGVPVFELEQLLAQHEELPRRRPTPTGESPFERDVRTILDAVGTMLAEKNRAYGDSALNPVRVFSQADPIEQIKVRIDDKLSRLARGRAAGEDVVADLLGYLVLLQVAQRRAAAESL